MSGETMKFPTKFDEFIEQYKITDTEQIYTNGADLIPVFRVKQWEDNRLKLYVPRSEAHNLYFEKSVLEMALDTAKAQLAIVGKKLHDEMDDVGPIIHAHWIVAWKDKNAMVYECSACHEQVCLPKILGMTVKQLRHCINCGAKMDETPKPIERM